jgi:hypothetical protein
MLERKNRDIGYPDLELGLLAEQSVGPAHYL